MFLWLGFDGVLFPGWYKQADTQDFGYLSGKKTGTCCSTVTWGKERIGRWDWAEGIFIKDGASILHHKREIISFCSWRNKTEQEGDSLLISHQFSYQHTSDVGICKLGGAAEGSSCHFVWAGLPILRNISGSCLVFVHKAKSIKRLTRIRFFKAHDYMGLSNGKVDISIETVGH